MIDLVPEPSPETDRSAGSAPPPTGRAGRLDTRERNTKWQHVPLLIDMSICINCDTCIRHCPPQFGAIFNHGLDVIIIPELCSGCGKCLDPCPVDCIFDDPDWKPAAADWWQEPALDDPYR
jgi:electron transport complex protein RnfB